MATTIRINEEVKQLLKLKSAETGITHEKINKKEMLFFMLFLIFHCSLKIFINNFS